MEPRKKGTLKIFFGYCAGCGKTYAMLQAAHVKQREGVDVVAGYIEPHDRPETSACMQGLEVLPPKEIRYHHVICKEFDLDQALARHPQLMLVDELAHNNTAGMRHPKRYSDIEELLRAGIDVYTTLNVQHLESLHDIVEGITRIKVNERIPDKVFDEADQIECIDIDPEDIRIRLKEGKIYRQKQAEQALDHFFCRDNLIALREIAMRRCADHMNRQIQPATRSYTKEHILVCLSPSPSNALVIRTAARMVQAFQADFTALYIETEEHEAMCKEQLATLSDNITLARHFHADIVSAFGENIAQQINEYARVSGISKIVIGRSGRQNRFLRSNLIDELTALENHSDIYVIPDKNAVTTYRKKALHLRSSFNTRDTLIAVAIILAATLINLGFQSLHFDDADIIMLYLCAVLLISYYTSSRIYGFIASFAVVLLFNVLFTVPYFSFKAYAASYPMTFAIMFLVSLTTSTLTRKLKKQSHVNAMQAYRTSILLETSQQLQAADTMSQLAHICCEQLYKLLDKTIIIYTVQNNTLQYPFLYQKEYDAKEEAALLDHNEAAVADWVLKNNKMAGVTTSTLCGARGLYMAIRKKDQIYAIIGIAMQPKETLPPFEKSILTTILNEIALAMDAMCKTKT